MQDIKWRKLRHLNGPATRVPNQIRRLSSEHREEREGAFLLLFDSFEATGRWFSASEATFAALLEAAERAPFPELHLALAAEVLTSDHVTAWASSVSGEDPSSEARAMLRTAAQWSASLLARLDDPRLAMRTSAAMLLAFCPDEGRRTLDALLRRLAAETDVTARASFLLAVAKLGAGEGTADAAIRAALSDPAALVRGAAGASLLRVRPSLDFIDPTAHLLDWLTWTPGEGEPAFPWFRGLVRWFHREVPLPLPANAALLAIAQAQGRTSALGEAAVAVAATQSPGGTTRRAGELILDAMGFPGDRRRVALPAELSDDAARVARAVAPTGLLPWAGRGLPASGAARRSWIGLGSPHPLDGCVTIDIDGTSLTLPRWAAWRELCRRGRAGGEIPPAVAAGFSPLDRWEAIVEFASETYGSIAGLLPKQVEAELARFPHDEAFFACAERLACDLAARIRTAGAEGRPAYPRVDVSALLFLPFARAGRRIEERWEPAVFMGQGGEEVFGALALARREAMVLERVPLDAGSYTELGVAYSLEVLPLVPTLPVIRRLHDALSRLPASPSVATYRARLEKLAAEHLDIASALEAVRRGASA
ncbi:MAG: hypothetical protein JW751_03510 [Polyangiaceae bacterium]|nr:hypothetical protein [Polyangiaceae bacterium]